MHIQLYKYNETCEVFLYLRLLRAIPIKGGGGTRYENYVGGGEKEL